MFRFTVVIVVAITGSGIWIIAIFCRVRSFPISAWDFDFFL